MTSMSTPAEFPEIRYRRVGADDDQVEKLREKFDELSYEDRVTEVNRVASLPDDLLEREVDHPRAKKASTSPTNAAPRGATTDPADAPVA